jgi:glycerol kinase
VVDAMRSDTCLEIGSLCVDGGPTKNDYLMQFQSDITNARIRIPNVEELSVLGTVYNAGIAAGFYNEEVFDALSYQEYSPKMDALTRERKIAGWKEAVSKLL